MSGEKGWSMNNSKPRMLVVDNEIDICNFVKSFFDLRGLAVATALDGDEAMARMGESKPDIVLLDVVMRSRDEGLEYLPRIKKAHPPTKVIIVTAMEDETTAESAKKLGADDFITKPLVLEYLETTVWDKIRHLKVVKAQ